MTPDRVNRGSERGAAQNIRPLVAGTAARATETSSTIWRRTRRPHTRSAYGANPGEAEHQIDELISGWVSEAADLRRRSSGRPPALSPPPATTLPFAGFMQDPRYRVRLLCRQPGFTGRI